MIWSSYQIYANNLNICASEHMAKTAKQMIGLTLRNKSLMAAYEMVGKGEIIDEEADFPEMANAIALDWARIQNRYSTNFLTMLSTKWHASWA